MQISIVGKDVTVIAYRTVFSCLVPQQLQISTEEESRNRKREDFPTSLTILSSNPTASYRIMRLRETFGKYTNTDIVGNKLIL